MGCLSWEYILGDGERIDYVSLTTKRKGSLIEDIAQHKWVLNNYFIGPLYNKCQLLEKLKE